MVTSLGLNMENKRGAEKNFLLLTIFIIIELNLYFMKYHFMPALALIFLLSCTKENNKSTPEPAIDPIPQFSVSAAKFIYSSKLLRREVSYIKTNPLLKYVRLFTYDGANRCTEIKLGTIDSSVSNPAFNLTQTLTFSYGGSNSLLPSSLASVRTVFPNLVTNFYYKYNSQGRKITDSVRVKNQAGDPADRTVHYVYDNDRVYTTPLLTGFSMENNSLDTLSLLTGGNIEKLVSRTIRSTGDQVVTYSFAYDKSISPYNKLNIANSLYFENAALGLGYNIPLEMHYQGVTTNNMTSYTTGSYTVIFKYLYDQDKYPVRKEMILPGDANPYQVSLFEY